MKWLISQYFVKKSSYLLYTYKGHRIAERDARFDLLRNMVFIVMYLFTLFVATVVALHISPPTIPLHAMIFDLVSATSNVGLNFGYLTPESPISLKWLYIFLMWVGRLEIFPFIILAAGFLYGFDHQPKPDIKKKVGK
jgi:trk system potassium uptake protein TrkH